jgi:hypothetical protein
VTDGKQLDPYATDKRRMNEADPRAGLVLILEDHVLAAAAQSRLAGQIGARAHVEHTADGALAFVAANDVSSMLVDVNLGPGGTGLDFLDRARNELACKAAALVFSGMHEGQLLVPPNRFGASFIQKPAPIDVLVRFYRITALWPSYRRTMERVVRHFETDPDEEHRLSTWHIELVQQFMFFGSEGIRHRLAVSDGVRKRGQRRLFRALGLTRLREIWEVLSLLEGVPESFWGHLLRKRKERRRRRKK